jgi:sugar fermentation stimulation protein A
VVLVRRLNRFVVAAERPGDGAVLLHLPNSGRMAELLVPGAPGLAHMPAGVGRRTAGTLLAVEHASRWVGVDAGLPNRLFEAALAARTLAPFAAFTRWQREVPFEGGRVDFVLRDGGVPCLVETKSCNRVDDGVALFPDAPTARGARHLRSLARRAAAGRPAAVVWFVQRDDARLLRPFRQADPAFADAVREARRAGVALHAYRCAVDPAGVTVLDAIPVHDA